MQLSPGTRSWNRPRCQCRQGQAVNRASWGQTGPRGDRRLPGGCSIPSAMSSHTPVTSNAPSPAPPATALPTRHPLPRHPLPHQWGDSSPVDRCVFEDMIGGVCVDVKGVLCPPPAWGNEGLTCPAAMGKGGAFSLCPAEPPARGQLAACSSASCLLALCGGRQLKAPGAARKEAAFKQQT